mgnify:CR=1 FL=1
MSTAILQIRVDSKLKKHSEAVLSEMGLKTSEAIRIFLQQIINDQAIPFRPHVKQNLPNAQTIDSFIEVENGNYSDSSLAGFKKSLKKK